MGELTTDQIATRIELMQKQNKEVLHELGLHNSGLMGCFGMPIDQKMLDHCVKFSTDLRAFYNAVEF